MFVGLMIPHGVINSKNNWNNLFKELFMPLWNYELIVFPVSRSKSKQLASCNSQAIKASGFIKI